MVEKKNEHLLLTSVIVLNKAFVMITNFFLLNLAEILLFLNEKMMSTQMIVIKAVFP